MTTSILIDRWVVWLQNVAIAAYTCSCMRIVAWWIVTCQEAFLVGSETYKPEVKASDVLFFLSKRPCEA